MRGSDATTGSLFSYVDLEGRVSRRHPLRLIRRIVNDVVGSPSGELESVYSHLGRSSIAPETIPRVPLLQAFYSIRLAAKAGRRLVYCRTRRLRPHPAAQNC